ncbi:MAG: hypothetical protein OHK0053_17470 [Microscillaceae bacterium]
MVDLDCQSPENLANSLPESQTEARRLFSLFEAKTYPDLASPDAQLDKLVSDITLELRSLQSTQAWQEDVDVLVFGLKNIKNEQFKAWNDALPPVSAPKNPASANGSMSLLMPLLSLVLFLALMGGGAYLYRELQSLRQSLEEMENHLLERYTRLDGRIDSMTPAKDYQSLLLRFNFLNEQLAALLQEVNVLKTRNAHKMTAEELYAKRTEHLESYVFNPDVQIYYARILPGISSFEQADFKTEPSRDRIYKIEINLNNPQQAVFSITDRREYHQMALLHADKMLAPACLFANTPYNDSRILTLEPGYLEKKAAQWMILKKAKIAFE